MKLIPDNANLNMALFLTSSAANRANEFQGKVILNHLQCLLLPDEKEMVKKDRCP